MNTTNVKLHLNGLLVCLLVTGCAGPNKATKLQGAAPQSLLVVPVEGQPVTVVSMGSAALGLLSVAIEQAATGGKREALAQRLNRDLKDFRPELVLAEECAKLLEVAPEGKFSKVTVRTAPVLMAGAETLLKTDTKPFRGRATHGSKWYSVFAGWRDSAPNPQHLSPEFTHGDALSLEVGFNTIYLDHGDKVEASAMLRLLHYSSMKVVGARYVGHSYDVRDVTLDSAPEAFKEDFRRIAQELAKEALTKMKLL